MCLAGEFKQPGRPIDNSGEGKLAGDTCQVPRTLHSTIRGRDIGVPGVLHQPIYQAYKGGLKLGMTRPITVSTGACAACNKPYIIGRGFAPRQFFFPDVGDVFGS